MVSYPHVAFSGVIISAIASQIHRRLDCLLNRLLWHRSKKTSKLHVTGLCEGEFSGDFPAQRASDVENVSIWWRHHGVFYHKAIIYSSGDLLFVSPLRIPKSLQWRHNERGSVSNHQCLHCLLNCRFRRRSKKTSKLRVTGLCEVNSPVTGEFPAQMASNAESFHLMTSWCSETFNQNDIRYSVATTVMR